MTAETGLFLLGAHGPQGTLACARAAEDAGLDAVWLAEHHFISYGTTPSATVLAGHLLASTNLRVGTAACVLSNRHPVALGEEVALLDALAPGRFRLGVARGGPWVDLEVFGTGLDRYANGFVESLDLLRRWLSGMSTVDATGPTFRFREVAVVPRPARPVPIWVAATSSSTVDIAAVRGLPLLLGVHASDDEKAATLHRYAAVCAGAGHDPEAVPHASVHLAFPAQTRAAGERALRAALPPWLARTRGYIRIDGSPPAHRDLESYVEHLLRIHAIGPDSLAALRHSAERLKVRHLLLMVEAAGSLPAVLDLVNRLSPPRPAAPTPRPGDGTRSRR